MKTGWIWYRLPDWVQGSLIIGVELAFHNGTLESIHFYPRGESESDEIDSWKDLSEEKERLRAEAAASWLRARGFPLGRYKWGEVWAGYDAKGAVGLGLVRYSP
ncbi:MAG: hypothetical protein EHM12_10815 [Dehalococcoidia bacterium]|nr:MAG: hypothetical protein EHM12_10815 [Dehalococcoidia bacterium]